MPDISRKRTRDRLKVRREPYWQRLDKGAYLGYRRGADSWIARYRTRDRGQMYQSLGAGLEYDEAKRRAEEWFEQMGAAAVRSARRGTVRDALEAYLKWLRDQGRESAAKTSEQRFKQIVYPDPLAQIELRKLTLDDMHDWRERLRPGRQPRTINRHVRSVVAGLNRAYSDLGYVGSPNAWKLTPLADDMEDAETAVHLTPDQRKALIEKVSPAAAKFLRGLELTGARPSELAAATAADFHGQGGTLTLRHRKGRPAKLRTRSVVLSAEGKAFFEVRAKGKLPTAPLFLDADSKPWERHEWAREIREAIAQHNRKARGKNRIPADASAYSFRHARISELLQIHGVDPLTVALQTGTSVRMIERAYFRFIAPALREKLSRIEDA